MNDTTSPAGLLGDTAPLGRIERMKIVATARALPAFRAFTARLEALGQSNKACFVVMVLTAAATIGLYWHGLINPDVAFLAWTAREVMGPPVFGIDIYEINPPLAFMLYTPAALLSPVFGFPMAIKLWMVFLALLSIAGVWQVTERALRFPAVAMLALYFVLAIPQGFGQREQIAFLLCAPYVAGNSEKRGWALLHGVMAGVGFAIKPHFLIPLVLVFATRRRIRIEECAIAVTGLLYAAVVLIFFQTYLFEFLPFAIPSYGSVYFGRSETILNSVMIALSVLALGPAGDKQPAARGYLAATIGFVIAALIQYKGFSYHFNAAWGFLLIFQVIRIFNRQTFTAVVAAFFVLAYAGIFLNMYGKWFVQTDPWLGTTTKLLKEIDASQSYMTLAFASFPAFPAALETKSQYVGKAFWPIYLPLARRLITGELKGDLPEAMRLSVEQVATELGQKPGIVIVPVNPKAMRGQLALDPLSLLSRNEDFNLLWRPYRLDKTVDDYQIYRRK